MMGPLAFKVASCTCLAGFLAVATSASASGLQVSPVSLTITERSEVLWLSNTSDQPLRAQVRVYHWSQSESENQLEATDDLLPSPPFLQIGGSGRQLVRIVRRNAADPTAPCEQAYRLGVDELPQPSGGTETTSSIQYLLSYSVPVFIVRAECENEQPRLTWQLIGTSSDATLVVENTGPRHARLSGLTLVNSGGERIELNPGLVGYVLPGAKMSFRLSPGTTVPGAGGQFEVSVNGTVVTQTLPLAPTSQ